MAVSVDQLVYALRGELSPASDLRSGLETAAEFLGAELGASRALLLVGRNGSPSQAIEWAMNAPEPQFDKQLLSIALRIQASASAASQALIVPDLTTVGAKNAEHRAIDILELGSALAVTCRENGTPWCTVVLFRESGSDPWRAADCLLLEQAANELTSFQIRLRENLPPPSVPEVSRKRWSASRSSTVGESLYQRLVENSDAIIFHADLDNVLQFVSRRALDFFGLIPEDFVSGIAVEWFDLIHVDQRKQVQDRALESQRHGLGFEDEFRVVNHVTGRERWLLVKLIPVRDEKQSIIGWDGFGVDITGRKEAQEALDIQSKKVRALYTVSAAIRGYLDPANIAARGLKALCDATEAEAGLCYLYDRPRARELSLVAHHGFSAGFSDRVRRQADHSSLFAQVAERGQSIVISDLAGDPRAKNLIDEDEGLRSALFVPIAVEEEVFGTLALFHHQAGTFDGGDVMLVAAAANQIGLAARQANLFHAYQKQTKNLSALYRMSHEVSHLHTLEDIFQQAFTIIRDELGLKRLWLGLLNDNGTRIVGQAAYGPGWKKRLVEMDVEIAAADNTLQEVIRARRAVLVHEPETVLGELGLRRFFSRFAIKALGLAPLIARGQVLGILAVQPGSSEPSMEEEELTLLSSLANEIATLILTRRLESRIAEAEKMRSAGLLAAGIAHNFNNILQAVLGQASLLEMQKASESQVKRSAKIISEAVTKGAALVRQLMSFANLEEPHPAPVNVNSLIESEIQNWSGLFKANQHLKLSLKAGIPEAAADARHLVRILTTLLSNAVDAMRDKGGPIQIFTDVVSTGAEVAHVEVPEGTYIRIGVRDSGVGMDAETVRRCFEPFFTTKNVDPGSGLSLSGAGLGLAAAYALARKNGGRLVVDSRPGQGSLFTLYIPVSGTLSAEKPKAAPEKNAPRPASPSKEKSV